MSAKTIPIHPLIRYPRLAQTGRTYLLTVDLEHHLEPDQWPYEQEEYPLTCLLESLPYFEHQPQGDTTLIIHRFGGTYGEVRFAIKAAEQIDEARLRLLFVNRSGLPVHATELSGIKILKTAAPLVESTASQRAEFSFAAPTHENRDQLAVHLPPAKDSPQPMDSFPLRPRVLILYAYQDEAWKDRMFRQLRVLEFEVDLEVWDDRRIHFNEWQSEFEEAIVRARVAVLLISADFLTSRFIRGQEIPELLRRRESEGLRVIPVIIRSCAWEHVRWLSDLQVWPKDARALASFRGARAEEQLAALALELRDLLTVSPTYLPLPGLKVFVGYSHQDQVWKERLVEQLRVLEIRDLEVWEERQIYSGATWQTEFEEAMDRVGVAVLLISADFLFSKFIRDNEITDFLHRREREGLCIIPVIIHPCSWQAVPWLAKLQCRPKDGKALALNKAKSQKHLADLALEIRDLLSEASPAAPIRAGDGAPLHNLPYPPLGDLFTGRQEELDVLADGGTTAIAKNVVISGLGGIGKTRLAVEYAWRSGQHYIATWFIRADSPESLRRNLAALAAPELLNLPEWEAQGEDEAVAAVKRSLRQHSGWLMILDNVNTPEAAEAVLEILPILSKGRVLITTRLTTWPANIRMQRLDTLPREEGVRFLLQRTYGARELAADDAARAADLAALVGDLPLALEQAAAYITRNRIGFIDYLRAWERESDKALKWYDPRVMQYPSSLAVTWKQTFDRLSPTPAALLRLVAFLAPDPIPIEVFEKGAEHVRKGVELFCKEVGSQPDSKSIREATADLADYSLITQQDRGMLMVHRMVQESLRHLIPEDQRRDWIEGALRLVNEAAIGDPGDVRTWPVWDRLRPHAAAIVAWADQEGIADPTSRLMTALGTLFWAKSLYSQAEPLLRRALAIDEAFFGSEHPNVARDLNNLARLLQETNRLEEAEPLLRRALAIDETSFGSQHPNVAISLNNLALLLQETSRLEEAEQLFRHALKIAQAAYGSQHPNVAVGLNNLAQLLRATNRLGESEPLLRRALEIDEASVGFQHPNVALSLNNLALLLQDTNRLDEAEPLMRRALDIYEKTLGFQHPNVARSLSNLAQLLHATNRLAEAEPLFRRSVEIFERSLGPEHPSTQTARRNLDILMSEGTRGE